MLDLYFLLLCSLLSSFFFEMEYFMFGNRCVILARVKKAFQLS